MTTAPPVPIPVTVVGGYLGAGKTTLVNHVLRQAHGIRFAVLVNDFGAINIDAELIESFDGETMQLANGCICCSLAGGFAETLFAVRAMDPRPDRVLVEASGVADPTAIAQYAHLDGFELDGVIVVADAETVRARARDRYVGRHVVNQLAGADLVVLNKVDLVPSDRLDSVRDWVIAQASRARVIEAVGGQVPMACLFGVVTPPAAVPRPLERSHLDHESWSVTSTVPFAADRFRELIASLPSGVVRAKGVLFLDDDPDRRHVFQLVGRRWSLVPGAPWGDESPSNRLVFIGLPGHHLAADLAAHFQDVT